MRKSFTTIMLGAVCLASSLAQADGLFSKVSIGSPFGSSETQGAVPAQPSPQRLAGPLSLSQMLTQAGMQPKELDGSIVGVSLNVAGKSLPVLMTFADNFDRIRMVMILNTLGEGQSLSSDNLIAMMDANRENSSVFFAFSKKQRRTELHRIVDNRSLTPSRLKAELETLIRVAEASQDAWTVEPSEERTLPPQNNVATTPKTQPAPQTEAPKAATPAPQPRQNTVQQGLIGQWTAARSKTEAFALRIDQAGTFALVTVVSGKTSQSKGKYTLSGSQLTLIDDKGTQLAGTVTLKSGKEFSFQPSGAKTALTFKKAG